MESTLHPGASEGEEPLDTSTGALAERLRTLQDEYVSLTSAISHDLQEPLRMVAGFMSLLEQEHAASLDGSAREYVAFAADGARRMQAMLEALSQLSRASVEPIEPAVVDPAEAWRLAQAQLRDAIEKAGGRVSADPLPLVEFDRRHLELLLTHLLDNALAASGAAAPVVRLCAHHDGASLSLRVEDQGEGLPLDRHERVFRPLSTQHRDQPQCKVGVGLPLARRLVHRNGGRIWLEPNQPRGLRVCFTVRPAQESRA